MERLTVNESIPSGGIEIPERHAVAARCYIEAIIARDRGRFRNDDFAELRRRGLWDRFEAEYRVATTGPYARHAGAALRLALGRL